MMNIGEQMRLSSEWVRRWAIDVEFNTLKDVLAIAESDRKDSGGQWASEPL